MKYGAVVGRFQTPELTQGHIKLLDRSRNDNDGLIVILGTIDGPPNPRNPLSFEVRKQMIQQRYPDALIDALKDESDHNYAPGNDRWSQRLDETVSRLSNNQPVTFYVGRDSFVSCYTGKYSIIESNFSINEICATELREQLKTVIFNSVDFRAGIIHANMNAWHRTYHTVDMALLKKVEGGIQICLIRKPNSIHWQLPGGFVNANELFTEAAAREMLEETGLKSKVGWKYVTDFMVDDWRVRGVPYVDHKTILMRGWANKNDEPVANDDVEDAQWFWIDGVAKTMDKLIAKGHWELLWEIIAYTEEGS
jgi:ADP-ribose pyrophosphatase YjhB (NUDIX family)